MHLCVRSVACDNLLHDGRQPIDRSQKIKKRNSVIFANLDVLVQAVKEYRRVSNIPKGEYTLLDLSLERENPC